MRLWSLHPSYLDVKGLLALWREGLLAQKVLNGRTVGYRHHPALLPFRAHENPNGAVSTYLYWVKEEACRRGYRFDASKIDGVRTDIPIVVSREAILFERDHLLSKLAARDVKQHEILVAAKMPRLHESFQLSTATAF